jgi:hypothetical protein
MTQSIQDPEETQQEENTSEVPKLAIPPQKISKF